MAIHPNQSIRFGQRGSTTFRNSYGENTVTVFDAGMHLPTKTAVPSGNSISPTGARHSVQIRGIASIK